MKATRVRASTSVKKEVLVGEYSSEWVVSDRTSGNPPYLILAHNKIAILGLKRNFVYFFAQDCTLISV